MEYLEQRLDITVHMQFCTKNIFVNITELNFFDMYDKLKILKYPQ